MIHTSLCPSVLVMALFKTFYNSKCPCLLRESLDQPQVTVLPLQLWRAG